MELGRLHSAALSPMVAGTGCYFGILPPRKASLVWLLVEENTVQKSEKRQSRAQKQRKIHLIFAHAHNTLFVDQQKTH